MTTYLDIVNFLQGYFSPDFRGTMVEVGAFHPTMISISYPLRNTGWNIISVEPNPEYIEEFRKMNFPILSYAACAEDKGKTSFKVSPNGASCSALEVKEGYKGFMGWTDNDYRTIEVEALTLNTILQRHHPDLRSIDILIIDVEGWELEVLDGFDIEKYAPKVVCIENFTAALSYIQYMYSKGYRLDRKDVQDEFYILNGS